MWSARFHPRFPASLKLLSAAAAVVCSAAFAADPARFSGRLAVELLEDIGSSHAFRLLDDLAFVDGQGKVWLAPKDGIVDDESLPRDLYFLEGLPYIAEYRKSAIIHRYYSRAGTEPWRQVHRTLYYASIAEGVSEPQARSLYAAVYAGGWRWEPRGSSCYRSCHASSPQLSWKPALAVPEIQPVLHWIARTLPSLDEIDERLDAAIRKPGPHLFAQGKE